MRKQTRNRYLSKLKQYVLRAEKNKWKDLWHAMLPELKIPKQTKHSKNQNNTHARAQQPLPKTTKQNNNYKNSNKPKQKRETVHNLAPCIVALHAHWHRPLLWLQEAPGLMVIKKIFVWTVNLTGSYRGQKYNIKTWENKPVINISRSSNITYWELRKINKIVFDMLRQKKKPKKENIKQNKPTNKQNNSNKRTKNNIQSHASAHINPPKTTKIKHPVLNPNITKPLTILTWQIIFLYPKRATSRVQGTLCMKSLDYIYYTCIQ